MEPIETEWKGYRFRSRLEARWAVFFESLDLEWRYEPEGFQLEDGTHYLPDFRVQTPYDFTFWYEVKPNTVDEDSKFDRFSSEISENEFPAAVKKFAVLLSGDPRSFVFEGSNGVCSRCGYLGVYAEDPAPRTSYCHPCDLHTASQEPWEDGALVGCQFHKGLIFVETHNGPDNRREYERIVDKATLNARKARFEHGESPSI